MTSQVLQQPLSDTQRWDAVARRDPAADGHFYYAVRTTGVYCRPSCAARHALRKNVSFFDTCTEAERAGFRPCRRCRPNEPAPATRQAAAIAKACRLIESSSEILPLAVLARAAGMSPYHFHRVFKALTGLTPKAYSDAHRGNRVRRELENSSTITEAIYGAGFNSNGRFYASSGRLLGMTPTAFRSGGEGVAIRFAVAECWLGPLLVAATDKGVCSIQLGGDPDALIEEFQHRFPKAQLIGGDPEFERMVAQVVAFVEEPVKGLNLPLDIRGTAFQERVWQALREIPAGATTTYSRIAQRIGQPKAVRAVAQACATNELAVAIPCHRVVRTGGGLSGYRWGVERKRALLEREARA